MVLESAKATIEPLERLHADVRGAVRGYDAVVARSASCASTVRHHHEPAAGRVDAAPATA
jgi:hypothetical protein